MPGPYDKTLKDGETRDVGPLDQFVVEADESASNEAIALAKAAVNAVWARHSDTRCPARVCLAERILRGKTELPYRGVIRLDTLEIVLSTTRIAANPYNGSVNARMVLTAAHEAMHAVQMANGETLALLSPDLDLNTPLEPGCPRPGLEAYRLDPHEMEADTEALAVLTAMGLVPGLEPTDASRTYETILSQEPLLSLIKGAIIKSIAETIEEGEVLVVEQPPRQPSGLRRGSFTSGRHAFIANAVMMLALMDKAKDESATAIKAGDAPPRLDLGSVKCAEHEDHKHDPAPWAPSHVKKKRSPWQ